MAAEALERVWEPDLPDLIPAASFIGVAEETGLLATMDDWVLGQTIEQSKIWQETFAGTAFAGVAISLTGRHLADAGFAESVIAELADHGLSTEALQIELTERVLMEASNSAMTGLKLLRDAGVKVGLDDLEPAIPRSPTCASSLSTLSRSTVPSSGSWPQAAPRWRSWRR